MAEKTKTFVLCGYSDQPDTKAYLANLIIELGGVYLDSENHCTQHTHLIATPLSRKEKCLTASAMGLWILPVTYIVDSHQRGHWLPEDLYEWTFQPLCTYYDPKICKVIGSAARTNRKVVQETGKKRFNGWTCFLYLSNPRKQKVYERILRCGDSLVCTPSTLKQWTPESLYDITHVFAESKNVHEVQNILKQKCLYLHVDYLRNYLLRDPIPAAELFQLGVYQPSSDLLNEINSQKITSKFSVPRLEVIIAPTMAVGKYRKIKRKVIPDLQKKKKLRFENLADEQEIDHVGKPLPSKTHKTIMKNILTVPIVKRLAQRLWGTQFLKDDESVNPYFNLEDVLSATEMPQALANLFNCCIDEGNPGEAVRVLLSISTPEWFPRPEILAKIFSMMLTEEYIDQHQRAGMILQQVTKFHPPLTKRISQMYLTVFEIVSGNKKSPWTFFSDVIRRCIAAEEHCEILFQATVDILVEDFKSFLTKVVDPSKELVECETRPLVSIIFWPDYKVGTVSKNCKELFKLAADLIKDRERSLVNLFKVLSLVLECVRLSAISSKDQREESIYNPNCQNFVVDIIDTCAVVFQDKTLVERFLNNIELDWFKMIISEMLLQTMSGIGFAKRSHSCLSLKDIVKNYMFPTPVASGKTHNARLTRFSRIVGMRNEHQTSRQEKKSVNSRNNKGETKVHKACMKSNIEELRSLLATPGVDVNARDFAGWTPLHEACNKGNIECVKLLLQWTPHPDYTPEDSNYGTCFVDITAASKHDKVTPLHDAVGNNHVEVAKLLLQYGGKALLEIKNKYDQIPLDMSKSEEMEQLLTSFSSAANIISQESKFEVEYPAADVTEKQCARSIKISYSQCNEFLTYLWCLTSSYMSWNALEAMSEAGIQLNKLHSELHHHLVWEMYETTYGTPPADQTVIDSLVQDLQLIPKLPKYFKKLTSHVEKLTGTSKTNFLTELYALEILLVF